jgi:hypothetical protein
MWQTYCNCTNLTTAVCGTNVTDMYMTYYNCTNLTTAACGPNATNMRSAYQGCTNIQGNFYIYSNFVNNFSLCFDGRNTSQMLNIYVHAGTTSNIALTNVTGGSSIAGNLISWTTSGANRYNARYNIYIYPVANVDAVRIANGDKDYMGNP